MDEKLVKHNDKLINMLQSPKASIRYEACNNLCALPEITPEARKALQIALSDPDSRVTGEAKRALNIHLPADTSSAKETIINKNAPINYSGIKTNGVATALRVIAWITYIGGFIAGLILGNVDTGYYGLTEFSFSVAIIYWVAAFISGTVFLGFAEIISLLQRIVDK
jgi:hypothetical protein